jgi:hypothetical protein
VAADRSVIVLEVSCEARQVRPLKNKKKKKKFKRIQTLNKYLFLGEEEKK